MSKAKVPILIKREMLKGFLAKGNMRSFYTEDVLYESQIGDFLKLSNQNRLTLYNKQNFVTNANFTVAKYVNDNQTTTEKTADSIIKLIGQKNYDCVYNALSAVENLEKKIKGILSLLLLPSRTINVSCQTDSESSVVTKPTLVDSFCQTDDTCLEVFIRAKQKKRVRRQHLSPYVVTDKPKNKRQVKKLVINPEEFKKLEEVDSQSFSSVKPSSSIDPFQKCDSSMDSLSLPNLGCSLDLGENSNDSTGKLSSLSITTTSENHFLLNNPLSILENVDKHIIEPVSCTTSTVTLYDGTVIQVPHKIEDQFHIATVEIMKAVSIEYRKKLMLTQLLIDWKFCLLRDDNDNLPIHVAAVNGDADLLRRQCIMLKKRNESVDVPVMLYQSQRTPLQIAVSGDSVECTKTLLQFGADPLVTDDDDRTCFHLAAESTTDHLSELVKHVIENPLLILQQNEELWSPELNQSKPEQYLPKYLLNKICIMNDNDGCTPLILASKLGRYENVKTLLSASPGTVNVQMPSSGETALYQAVHAACVEVNNSGKRFNVNGNYKKTLELLIEGGADPTIDNYSGININVLLTDINVPEYSMIIANKLSLINCMNVTGSNTPHIIIDNNDGSFSTMDLKTQKGDSKKAKGKKDTTKPIIIQDVKIEKTSPIAKHKLPFEQSLSPALKRTKLDTNIKASDYIIGPADLSLVSEPKIENTNFLNSFKSFVESSNVNRLPINCRLTFANTLISKKQGAPPSVEQNSCQVIACESSVAGTSHTRNTGAGNRPARRTAADNVTNKRKVEGKKDRES